MKRIKLFEDFINNNIKGDIIDLDSVINCIKSGGKVYAKIIKGLPDNDPDLPLTPLSVDEDGLVTVDFDGNEYEIPLKNITKLEL